MLSASGRSALQGACADMRRPSGGGGGLVGRGLPGPDHPGAFSACLLRDTRRDGAAWPDAAASRARACLLEVGPEIAEWWQQPSAREATPAGERSAQPAVRSRRWEAVVARGT